jgi:hypothetical protein
MHSSPGSKIKDWLSIGIAAIALILSLSFSFSTRFGASAVTQSLAAEVPALREKVGRLAIDAGRNESDHGAMKSQLVDLKQGQSEVKQSVDKILELMISQGKRR